MTRPKWKRKKQKATEYLNALMGYSLRLGYISLHSKSGKKDIKIDFFNKELGEFDQRKFSTYFGAAIKTLKDVYTEAGKKENKNNKKYKAVIKEDIEDIVNGVLWIVYKNWEDYGYEITL